MDDLQPSENEDKSPHSNPDTAGTDPETGKPMSTDSAIGEWPSTGVHRTSFLCQLLPTKLLTPGLQ